MGLAVNIVCRNMEEDRVVPRFARYLRDTLAWELTARPVPSADVYYLSGYFEAQLMPVGLADRPVAAYMTHREEEPPGNRKAVMFDAVAKRVQLRIATAKRYAELVSEYGPTLQITPPLDRGRFTIPSRAGGKAVVGFSGFAYSNHRKGEDLAAKVVGAHRGVTFLASGRGWPCPTREYPWAAMPIFYQSLDVLVVLSRVEGIPMPPLEALACGVSVVIPQGVGLLDELPEVPGIYRYPRGDIGACNQALARALSERGAVSREALREVTSPFTITAWCEQHRLAFQEVFEWNAVYTL